MAEALQVSGRSQWVERPARYGRTAGVFDFQGGGRIRDGSTQVYRKASRRTISHFAEN